MKISALESRSRITSSARFEPLADRVKTRKRGDGAQSGFTGRGVIVVPWGVNIDGNDDVRTTPANAAND